MVNESFCWHVLIWTYLIELFDSEGWADLSRWIFRWTYSSIKPEAFICTVYDLSSPRKSVKGDFLETYSREKQITRNIFKSSIWLYIAIFWVRVNYSWPIPNIELYPLSIVRCFHSFDKASWSTFPWTQPYPSSDCSEPTRHNKTTSKWIKITHTCKQPRDRILFPSPVSCFFKTESKNLGAFLSLKHFIFSSSFN